MLRGYFAGLLSGTIVSGVVLAGLSVLTEVPGDRPPEATAVEVPAGSEFDQSREDDAASLPRLQETQTPDEVPQVTAPALDDLSSLEGADSTTSAPAAGDAEAGLTSPETSEETSGIRVDSEDPVLPNPQAMAPEAPVSEDNLSISTEPAQPVQPATEDDSVAFPTPEQTEAEPAQDDPVQPAAEAAPQPEADLATAEAVEDTAPEGQQTPSETAEAAQPEATEPVAAQTASDVADDSTIGNLAEGVTTGRLPTALDTDAAEEPVADTTADAATEADEAPVEDTRPPIERFAASFENPENKPLMAIILIDDGSSSIGPEALADFPYPLSFAVDASKPNAAATAAKYRAAELEVLAMTNLSENATAADAEVAMEIYLAAVPEAVAVFEGTGTGLQASREASAQLAPILRDSGHGLVMFPNGLNTAQKLVARQGVPSATIFRDFDAKGQNASAIRRFLDQAAFRAGQEEGGVIMVGRLRPDTISALLLWGLQDRAASVALAPVSAVLTAE